MTATKPSASLCPVCGGDNQCAVAAGEPPASCWCQQVSFSREALAQAADSAGERCLCPACGRATIAVPLEG